MLRLYCAPLTVSAASVIMLNETGVDWEPVRVDMAAGEQRGEAYLKINPKGRVPVLDAPEGLLTETIAILEYLAETLAPALRPADPWGRARMREAMTYLASTMHVNHAHKRRGARWADRPESLADMTAKVPRTMTASAGYIDGLLAGPYLLCARPSAADPYLYTVLNWLPGDGVDVTPFPAIRAFMAEMETRPAVAKARAEGFFG